jgi:hypothetical protein
MMDISAAKDLVELLDGRSHAWNALWAVFYTVGVALLGVIASGKLLSRHRTSVSLIAAFGFLMFAIGNYQSLDEMRIQREEIVKFVKKEANAAKLTEIAVLAEAASPPKSNMLRAYHWTLSFFIIALLVCIPRALGTPKDE